MTGNSWRVTELAHHADNIQWLTPDAASRAYSLATLYAAKARYGLDTSTVEGIEHIDFDDDVPAAQAWLRASVGTTEQLVVVFGDSDYFRCQAGYFLEHWQDIFIPGRDDAVIYAAASPLVLFFCHENEFEAGRRVVYD